MNIAHFTLDYGVSINFNGQNETNDYLHVLVQTEYFSL